MSLFSRLTATPGPTVALAIDSQRVAALRVAPGGGGRVVSAVAEEDLPVGTVQPALAAANVADAAAVSAAVSRVLAAIGGGVRRAALVVPDSVAKVSLVRFERVPTRVSDLDGLIRSQVRKSVPFRLEDGVVSWTPGVVVGDGREYVVAVARADVIGQYEAACTAAGVHVGLVDLATFSVANAAEAGNGGAEGDWLLVHVTPDYLSLAVVRGRHPVFFRHRGAEGEEPLAELVHQTAMYYEDRLEGRGFTRALLAGAAGADVRRQVEDRLRCRVETVDPTSAIAVGDRVSIRAEALERLAPLVGILAREDVA